MDRVTLESLRREAEAALDAAGKGTGPGAPLDPLARALVILGLTACVTALDRAALDAAIGAAFDAGASVAQVQEVIALISGLGVHSLMVSAVPVLDAARRRGLADAVAEWDSARQTLWDTHVGEDPFWNGFERENPGFLKAMLTLSPDIFAGFFAYCAIPWQSGTVRAVVKELIAMASDATPTHRFSPGFRVHLNNAIALGAGRAAILETLDIAASAPLHCGTA